MAESTLSEVHADLVGRLKHDERLRMVEQAQAASSATMQALLTEVAADRVEQRDTTRQMEARLTAAINDAKPKNVASWASVVIAAVAVVVAIVAYTVH
jgi:type VI protein secretion system component VasF